MRKGRANFDNFWEADDEGTVAKELLPLLMDLGGKSSLCIREVSLTRLREIARVVARCEVHLKTHLDETDHHVSVNLRERSIAFSEDGSNGLGDLIVAADFFRLYDDGERDLARLPETAFVHLSETFPQALTYLRTISLASPECHRESIILHGRRAPEDDHGPVHFEAPAKETSQVA